jgi:hypothetical protein
MTTPSTHDKAVQINIYGAKYGTFAEIGAGWEVARWFFQVGGEAGTVAKAISVYDMTMSDAIDGPSDRYVSRRRLQAMLEREYVVLREQLETLRGDRSAFFVLANTVATRSYSHRNMAKGGSVSGSKPTRATNRRTFSSTCTSSTRSPPMNKRRSASSG